MDLHYDPRLDVSPLPDQSGVSSVDGFQTRQGERTLQMLTDRLSHRLLGLVNSIEGYTHLLAHTLGTEEQRELSLRILEGAARIERVIQDLRRFSTSFDPVVRPVTARELVDGLGDLLGPKRWRRVDVEWKLAERPLELLVDPVLVRQALLALVQNAFEAAPKRSSIRLAVSAGGRNARFSVWNEGYIRRAVPPEKIFEPFFSTKGPNLGIGLALTCRIAEAHDGGVELLCTDAEAGTCLALDLPHSRGKITDDLVLPRG